jgi:glyoxylase-like metal-dependent hydrolase (beta-lactamase superfamily II)
MEFYFWLIRDESHAILVDTGWSESAVSSRQGGRRRLADAREAIRALGTDPDSISHIVVTHMHYDHTGNLAEFPEAQLLVQEEEYRFWTSRYAAFPPQAVVKEDAEVDYVTAALKKGRATLLEGKTQVLPGIEAILVGGHTPGQQIVTVRGDREIILASDALHFYEEMERDRCYEVFADLRQMYDAYAEMRRRRDDGSVIVAGHDPQVMQRFPLVEAAAADELAVRISQ